ncbi:MAG TPA: family 10 glycosylhydrolase, partial [Thermoanaerobaculia bacterium]
WIAALVLFTACTAARQEPAHPARELRGVWVATVNNIDWPSRRDLTPEQQRAELIAMFDRFKAVGLNAVFLQVRPACDAIYPSAIEPWSEYLTGTMGVAPEPLYDPLAFAVAEAHARGLELHAWFNPYRARHPSASSAIAANHVAKRNPERVREYGTHLWLDPGDDDARRESLDVVRDVISRYDVDGVHLDDYFYPYPENDQDFPDEPTWQRYVAGGGNLDRNDWRRENVNRFIRELYQMAKATRPNVHVSISPFGIWRPGHPQQIAGFDAYDKLYADSRLWLQRGWLDTLVPQLYWPIDKREQSFPVLLDWWTGQNKLGKGLVVGMSISRVGNTITADEIARQLAIVRKEKGAAGFILFSAKALMDNRGGVADVVAKARAW